jgi:hypothetical protein
LFDLSKEPPISKCWFDIPFHSMSTSFSTKDRETSDGGDLLEPLRMFPPCMREIGRFHHPHVWHDREEKDIAASRVT